MSGKVSMRMAAIGLAVFGIIVFTGSCTEITTAAATSPPAKSQKAAKSGGREAISKPVSREQSAEEIRSSTKIQSGQITGVDMGQVFTMMQANRILLVDCRPPIFYRVGHIDGAINLPLKSYDKVIDGRKIKIQQALAEEKIIVLYCQNVKCPDAYAVAKKLALIGHSVSIYKGGWEEWKQAGL